MNILDLSISNTTIIEFIEKNIPFSIIRLGIGNETYISYDYLNSNKINKKYLHPVLLTLYNAGIYTNNKDVKKIELFCISYTNAIKNADVIASFTNSIRTRTICNIQNYFSQQYNLPQIHSRSLEPFYIMLENETPWTHYLKNKKVLIIHPFVESFKKQLKNGFQLFKNKQMFLDNQEFLFYKPYQTIAGNHIHNDWVETFTLMCDDIKNLDFDIALLGCGGYGLPLCNYIKSKLNKSAIYIGGGLQLLFGIMGNRWDTHETIQTIIKENECKFIRPSNDELCKNHKTIENSCYW